MKKILLLGDSIRLGYDNYVKESLKNVAEVYLPEENCAYTVNDLYALLEDKPESYNSDQTHYYTPEATVLIGDKVTNVLCDALDLDKSKLVKPDMSKYELIKAKSDTEMFIKRGNYYAKVLGI